MKLSDAILAGCKLVPKMKTDGGYFTRVPGKGVTECCAIGAAMVALKGLEVVSSSQFDYHKSPAHEEWTELLGPEINSFKESWPAENCLQTQIVRMNDGYRGVAHLTREQIASRLKEAGL